MAKQKERGELLVGWLIIVIIFSIITAWSYFSIRTTVIPSFIIYALGILALLNILFVILLFMWKKIGLFGYSISAVTAFIINIVFGSGIISLFELVGPVVLYLLLISKWDYFE